MKSPVESGLWNKGPSRESGMFFCKGGTSRKAPHLQFFSWERVFVEKKSLGQEL